MAYQTINPYTDKLVRTFSEHTDAIVKRAASILRDKIDEFAEPITIEMGKLFREAQAEVELSADILDYYADNAEKCTREARC
jgi:succinate-semialdehyde dehydrogenase / glutarate-semialdehyde dehydrogenase